MEIFTRVSTLKEKSMDKASMSGSQENTMRASGSWAIRMAMVSGKAFLETLTLASGEITSLMDSVSIFGAMETSMRVSGRPVLGMDKAAIPLLEETSMSENTPGERLRDMANTLGKTEIYIPDSFSTDRKMAREAGRKVGMPTQILTRATTSWIRSMDMESSSGALAVNTKGTTKTISKKDMVKCIGPMVVSTEVSGSLEFNPASA